jgi:hypothetical protein
MSLISNSQISLPAVCPGQNLGTCTQSSLHDRVHPVILFDSIPYSPEHHQPPLTNKRFRNGRSVIFFRKKRFKRLGFRTNLFFWSTNLGALVLISWCLATSISHYRHRWAFPWYALRLMISRDFFSWPPIHLIHLIPDNPLSHSN